ncbi:peptide deformylase [Thaumasiovibrio subtropicus]|uniref:peptide deformylase n=1 Tax=Thaumasiovibrio subtropicus TaxID=1891207 RepID=UPI000B352FD4|nr:peptide deformylase [Thaumasiovibrio subtropicus]
MIRKLGDDVLREKAKPIADIGEHLTLFDEMLIQMQAANGVGIAAPQLGQSVRAFIVASNPNPRYPDAPSMPPELMINPELLSHGEEKELGWEGCLSVPERRGEVYRYRDIVVRYQNVDGESVTVSLNGFVARIFQHELDHLDGVLFVDRAEQLVDVVPPSE